MVLSGTGDATGIVYCGLITSYTVAICKWAVFVTYMALHARKDVIHSSEAKHKQDFLMPT